jgi:hypothetical protein
LKPISNQNEAKYLTALTVLPHPIAPFSPIQVHPDLIRLELKAKETSNWKTGKRKLADARRSPKGQKLRSNRAAAFCVDPAVDFLETSEHFKLKRLGSDGQDRARRFSQYLFGNAAQEHMRQPASAVRAHDDQVRFAWRTIAVAA